MLLPWHLEGKLYRSLLAHSWTEKKKGMDPDHNHSFHDNINVDTRGRGGGVAICLSAV